MKNTTTEQKSLKNITTIENITTIKKTNMEKTAIQKITAKITTTALLFFLALFSLTTCLTAQEGKTTGKKAGLVCGGESLFFHRG